MNDNKYRNKLQCTMKYRKLVACSCIDEELAVKRKTFYAKSRRKNSLRELYIFLNYIRHVN